MKTKPGRGIGTCAIALLAKIAAVVDRNDTVFPLVETLPRVPHGFEIAVFAAEWLLYKPTSFCFDAKGRAMVKEGSRTAACAK